MFVKRFMSWAQHAPVEQRVKATENLVRNYLNGDVGEEDRPKAEQVFTLLLDDPSMEVRSCMAFHMSASCDAPKTIVWSLCEDLPEISVPIYESSPLLGAANLAHAASTAEPIVQKAIAGRPDLDSKTVRQLVSHGAVCAVMVLLDNSSVILGPGLKHDISLRLGDEACVRDLLLEQDDLRSETRQLLARKLTIALTGWIESSALTESSRTAQTASDACNRVSVEIAMQTTMDAMPAYVEHLLVSGQLTPALLIRAICCGNANFFEAALAALSGSSLKRVQSIVDDGRISAFRSLYGRTGLPESSYSVFAAAVTVWQKAAEESWFAKGEAANLNHNVIMAIIERVENCLDVDAASLALVSRLATEANRDAVRQPEEQLLLAAA